MIPIIALLICGFLVVSRSEIGRAFAHRLRTVGVPLDSSLAAEVEELRNEVTALRTELSETQERLDFTERVLAAGKQEG